VLRNKRKSGRPPKLNPPQLSWIAKHVRENNPLQLNFPFALWTLVMVRERIWRERIWRE
jgi:transposase